MINPIRHRTSCSHIIQVGCERKKITDKNKKYATEKKNKKKLETRCDAKVRTRQRFIFSRSSSLKLELLERDPGFYYRLSANIDWGSSVSSIILMRLKHGYKMLISEASYKILHFVHLLDGVSTNRRWKKLLAIFCTIS